MRLCPAGSGYRDACTLTETLTTTNETPACETAQGSVSLKLSDSEVIEGEIVIVTVVLQNEGCLALGLPQYRLTSQAVQGGQLDLPAPVVHSLAVASGSQDEHVFLLNTGKAGEYLLTAHTSFEVHVGYPGPAYWGAASVGDPVRLDVVSLP